jgi:hypothetical protein
MPMKPGMTYGKKKSGSKAKKMSYGKGGKKKMSYGKGKKKSMSYGKKGMDY